MARDVKKDSPLSQERSTCSKSTLYPVVPIVCFGIKLSRRRNIKIWLRPFSRFHELSVCFEPVGELVSTAAVGGDVIGVLGVLDSSIISSFGSWALEVYPGCQRLFMRGFSVSVTKQISFPLLLVPAVGSHFWHHVRLSETKRRVEAKYIFKVIQFNG